MSTTIDRLYGALVSDDQGPPTLGRVMRRRAYLLGIVGLGYLLYIATKPTDMLHHVSPAVYVLVCAAATLLIPLSIVRLTMQTRMGRFLR